MGGRLLHVVGDSKFGGASALIARLAAAAGHEGYDVDVLTTDPVFTAYLHDRGIGTVEKDLVRRAVSPWRDARDTARLTDWLKDADYSIVHTHTSKGGLVGRYAAWHARIRFVVHTVHGFAFHEGSSPASIRLMAGVERLAARWCHRIVTVSEYHRVLALQLHVATPDKIVAIPNGIDPDLLAGKNPAARDPHQPAQLVNCGRLAPQKGIEHLLEAMPAIHSLTGAHLVLVGDGPMRAELEQQVRDLDLIGYVRFAGFQSDVRPFVAAADVAVLPSEREGLSIALLESMASGLPVVTTRISSNVEATAGGDCALLVPTADPAALATAVIDLLQHPQQAGDMGRRAASRVRTEYTEQRMLAAYLDLYAEGLSRGREQRA